MTTPWADKAQARSHWPDAVNLDDALLDVLLEAATEQLAASRTLPLPDPIPTRWALANIYHARDLYQAGQRNGDVIGFGDYAVRARPMSSTVKQLMDPPRGWNAPVG